MNNEQIALALASDRKLLFRRLSEAKRLLNREARKEIVYPVFDYSNKRLIGTNGLILQWQTRRYPDLPESPENQQTSIGSVFLIKE